LCLNYAADQEMSFYYNSVDKRKTANLMTLSISKPESCPSKDR
jgi:hypothetical protein